MTSIEWVKGDDGSDGLSWNALRAERVVIRKGKPVTVSANHCEHVNEACRWCYSERGNPRLGGLPFKPGHRKDYRFVINEEKLREPIRRRKPTRIFVESTSDAFGEWWPREFVHKLYAVMMMCPHHLFINLSKRPARRRDYLADPDTPTLVAHYAGEIAGHGTEWTWPLPNVVEGVSVSCQPEADEFLPILLTTKAAIYAVSCEPLLGPINLTNIDPPDNGYGGKAHGIDALSEHNRRLRGVLDWVIVGGESGPSARPMHPAWPRTLRDQCDEAGTAFFFKQWGEWAPHKPVPGGDLGGDVRAGRVTIVHPTGQSDEEVFRATGGHNTMRGSRYMARVGKKAAGRLLDGREHNDMPALPRIEREVA